MTRSTGEVVKLVGVTFKQLDYWIRRGYVDAPIRGPGRGDRHWPESEVNAVILIHRMTKAGIRADKAARVARLLIDNPSDKLARSVRIGKGVWVLINEKE